MENQVYDFIVEFKKENGYSPTHREIMAGAGVSSTSMVSFYLRILWDEELITFEPFKSRTIKIVVDDV